MNEYEEQKAIERIALARHPDAISVKEIKPFIMSDETDDTWLVILTTATEHEFRTTLVTKSNLKEA